MPVAVRLQERVRDDPGSRRLTFERDGFVVIPGALGPGEVDSLRVEVDRVYRRHGGSGPLHLLAFLGESHEFVDLLDHPETIPFVAEVLGDNIHCYHCHLDVHPGGEVPRDVWMWHQDGGIINRDLETAPRPRLAVKVAFFLTDVSAPGHGNLVVLPGSHRSNRLRRTREDPAGAVPVLASPGDAVVFDRRLWHRRSPNLGEHTRRVLFLAYTYRWIRPRDDLEIPDRIRARATAAQRQLLGEAGRTIDHWMPDVTRPPLRDELEVLRGR
jgi:ectoine hydroxylase